MAGDPMMPCRHWMSPCFPTLAAAHPNHVGLPENTGLYLTVGLRRRHPEGTSVASLRLFTINRNRVHARRNAHPLMHFAMRWAKYGGLDPSRQGSKTRH